MMGISCSHLELVNIQLSNEAIYHFLEKLANPQICVSGPVERGQGGADGKIGDSAGFTCYSYTRTFVLK